MDYIGEIALVKDFTSTMDVVMTPEEKAAMEAAAKAEEGAATPATAAEIGKAADAAESSASAAAPGTASAASSSAEPSSKTSPANSNTDLAHHTGKKAEFTDKSKTKLTPEQKAKLDELESQKEKERKVRYVLSPPRVIGSVHDADV